MRNRASGRFGVGMLLGVLFGGSLCQQAAARTCADLGLEYEARSSELIFSGQIVDDPERVVFTGEEGQRVRADRYEVEVDRYYLGHLGTQVSLFIPNEWHEYGMPRLGKGAERVFFAQWWRGRVATHECSGTFRPFGGVELLGPGAEPVELEGPAWFGCGLTSGGVAADGDKSSHWPLGGWAVAMLVGARLARRGRRRD